ncbi:uncharacterized protein LOC117101709 [Anneissia japonica]|uniref:uncharacterized protein LOC117101709 n=1 Tax=Anneissia japonica TaxID=1529436 RepID=UPI001425809B|nr:uncharacterized protein LOC117101709 [Anneissia japonica]
METWWWNVEVQDSIKRKTLAKKNWDYLRDEESKMIYKEARRETKRAVAKAKENAYEELYERLNTKEEEKDLYRLAKQRDRAAKDVQQVRTIKNVNGNVLTDQVSVLKRWKEYFERLMNEENEREQRAEEVDVVDHHIPQISEYEVREALMVLMIHR